MFMSLFTIFIFFTFFAYFQVEFRTNGGGVCMHRVCAAQVQCSAVHLASVCPETEEKSPGKRRKYSQRKICIPNGGNNVCL